MEVSVMYGYNVVEGIKNFKIKSKKEIEKLTAMNVVELDVVAKNIYVVSEWFLGYTCIYLFEGNSG